MPKISALPIATTIGTGDLLVLDQSLITKSVTFNILQSAVGNAGVVQSLISQAVSGGLSIPSFASNANFTQVGAGATQRTVQDKEQDSLSVFDFMTATQKNDIRTGSPSIDATPSIMAASVAAIAYGMSVDFGGWTYLIGSQIALTSAHANLKWFLRGATLKKAFNGDLVTVTNCTNFSVDGVGIIDGVMTSFTGKGFVLSGSGSSYFYLGPGILTKAFAGAHVEYGPDAGFSTKLMCDMLADPSQLTPTMIACLGPDSSAQQRSFWGRVIGTISLTGALATEVKCSMVNQVSISSTCSVTLVSGVSWSNNGNPITIDGQNTIIVGCRMAGAVTINSTATGYYAHNLQTAGGFTNNSANMVMDDNHVITFPVGSAALPGFTPLGDPSTGFWQRTLGVLTASMTGLDAFEIQNAKLALGQAMLLAWGNATKMSSVAAFDTGLARNATGIVEVNTGTPGIFGRVRASYLASDASQGMTSNIIVGAKSLLIKDGVVTGYA